MKQTIAQMRILARDMGVTLPELIRRRFARESVRFCLRDDDGTLRIAPKVEGNRTIPDSWKRVYRT